MSWETITQTKDFIIDYDKERAMYRVSYFQGNHFVDDVMFDAYDPMKHGEWIETGYESLFSKEVECSNCGKTQIGVTKHCPNCGAKMKED